MKTIELTNGSLLESFYGGLRVFIENGVPIRMISGAEMPGWIKELVPMTELIQILPGGSWTAERTSSVCGLCKFNTAHKEHH